MSFYDYECEECGHKFETQQSIKAEPLTTCPECGKESLYRVIYPPIVKVDPQTIGTLAEKNRKKMGHYEREKWDKENPVKDNRIIKF